MEGSCKGVSNPLFPFSTARLLILILAILLLPHHVLAKHRVGLQEALQVLPHTEEAEISRASNIFTLRHVYHHGTYKYPGLHRKVDIKSDDRGSLKPGGDDTSSVHLLTRSRFTDIQRLKDRRPSTIAPLLTSARRLGYSTASHIYDWTIDRVLSPDITDKETILTMARMANNAYSENETSSSWVDIGGRFNRSLDFGFDADGLQGHIFANEDNSTIIISIKGTTASPFDSGGTTTNDKINDNLFGSCCCAQQGQYTWRQVCDCATSTFTCNNTCAVQAIREENRYFSAANDVFTNATSLYPNAHVWLTGHSLGGLVASLLGLTYGIPTVTYEAVPDALAAARLGLPVPPGSIMGAPQTRPFTGSFHIGHTADPVFMGVCNGATSSCSMFGYAFESQCHTGSRCVYDVVGDKGWRVSIRTHSIRNVIDDVIVPYAKVPDCEPEPECQDCFNWKFYESNHTDVTTSKSRSSSTMTRTRTETCKTPGWWGCLDESTTTTKTTTTTSKKTTGMTTTTSSTTTCKTPGWFGCNDPTPTITPALVAVQVAIVAKTGRPTHSLAPSA